MSNKFDNQKGMPSQRQLRVGEQVRQALSEAMQQSRFNDPILSETSHITVTSVDVSPDLKNAVAYVMPLGGENSDEIIQTLNKVAGVFRKEISRRLELRYTPKISFRTDTSFDEAEKINSLLQKQQAKGANFVDDEETDEDSEE